MNNNEQVSTPKKKKPVFSVIIHALPAADLLLCLILYGLNTAFWGMTGPLYTASMILLTLVPFLLILCGFIGVISDVSLLAKGKRKPLPGVLLLILSALWLLTGFGIFWFLNGIVG